MFSDVIDFNAHNKCLTAKRLKQGNRYHKLRKAFSKFTRQHYELISKFSIGSYSNPRVVFVSVSFGLRNSKHSFCLIYYHICIGNFDRGFSFSKFSSPCRSQNFHCEKVKSNHFIKMTESQRYYCYDSVKAMVTHYLDNAAVEPNSLCDNRKHGSACFFPFLTILSCLHVDGFILRLICFPSISY